MAHNANYYTYLQLQQAAAQQQVAQQQAVYQQSAANGRYPEIQKRFLCR